MRLQNDGQAISTRNESVISLNSTINSHTGAGLKIHGSFSVAGKSDNASFLKLVAYETTAIDSDGTIADSTTTKTVSDTTSGTLVDFRSNGKLWVRHGLEVVGDFDFKDDVVPGGAEITHTNSVVPALTATARSLTDANATKTTFAGTLMAVEANAIQADNYTLLEMGTTASGVIFPLFTVLGNGKTTIQAGGLSVEQHHGANIAEIQTITTSVDDTIGGTFTLTFGGSTTTALSNDISVDDVLTALSLLTGLSSGVTVSRAGAVTAGCYTWTITFTGLGNVAELVAASSLTGTNAAVAVLTTQIGRSLDEVQTITTSVDDSIGGIFALSFGSHTTTFVDVDVSAVDMQATLSSLTGLSSGLTVTRTSTATSGCYTWSVTFSGLGNVAQLVASTLTTASPTSSPTTAPTASPSESPTTSPSESPTESPTAARRLLMSGGYNNEGEEWAVSGRRVLTGNSLTGTTAAITIDTVQEGRSTATAFKVEAGGLTIIDGGEIVEKGGVEITAGDLHVATNRVEIQTVTTSVDDTIGGSFTLSFGGSVTSALASDASAADILGSLNLLTGLASGVSVTRADASTTGCFTWHVTFTGLGDVVELSATSSLTGTTAAVAVVTSKAYLPSVSIINTASQQGSTHTFSSNGRGIDLQNTAAGHFYGALLTVRHPWFCSIFFAHDLLLHNRPNTFLFWSTTVPLTLRS
jgi:hypothetical protein